jgi:hypothetical protein
VLRSEVEHRATGQRRPACAGQLLPEISGPKRVRQRPPRIGQDGLVALDVPRREAVERRGNEQRPHQMTYLVEDGHGEASGTLDILGKREIHPRTTGLVDALHQLISVEDGSGRNPSKIRGSEKSLTPVGRLKRNKHDAESAVQRNLPRKRLDGLRLLRTKAPIHHDGLASLQDGEAAVFPGGLGQPFDMRMNDLQQPPKRIERRGKRKKPCAQAILAIFEPLENSVFDKRAGNTGNRRHGQPNALAYLRHRDGSILCNGSNDPDSPIDDLDRHRVIFGQSASRHKVNCGLEAVSLRMRREAKG